MTLIQANALACDLSDDELVIHARFVASVLHGRRLISRELDELEARRDTEPAPFVGAQAIPQLVLCDERCGYLGAVDLRDSELAPHNPEDDAG
jgi:hypothetical protein